MLTMTLKKSTQEKALSYQQELIDIRELLQKRPVNWWQVYPMMVRVNEQAKEIEIKQPFNRKQMSLAKEKLCNSPYLASDH
jgi:hypothetical protein